MRPAAKSGCELRRRTCFGEPQPASGCRSRESGVMAAQGPGRRRGGRPRNRQWKAEESTRFRVCMRLAPALRAATRWRRSWIPPPRTPRRSHSAQASSRSAPVKSINVSRGATHSRRSADAAGAGTRNPSLPPVKVLKVSDRACDHAPGLPRSNTRRQAAWSGSAPSSAATITVVSATIFMGIPVCRPDVDRARRGPP